MAVFKHFDTDPNGWEYYYTYHAHPFRSTISSPDVQLQGVQIGLNPNSKSSDLDLSGFIIRPQRFNDLAAPNIRTDWDQNEPMGDDIAAGEINAWNNGHWPAYAITPQHVVVCGHFIGTGNGVVAAPFSFEGPWPWTSNTEKKVLFMNPDGEYKVHDYEFVNIDLARDGKNEHLGGGDAVLLELTEPIAEDSGIKIYNKSYVLDNDQQFAVFTRLDSNGRTYQRIYQGFQSTIGTFGESAQFRWHESGVPVLVEERKLPGGDLENETLLYAGTQNTSPNTFLGDSGTPLFAHSRSRGTITVMGPGGTNADQVGPWAKHRVEKFQQYLQSFNEENGTDYTFDYEVITDAITDIRVPPLIDPLVCKTQEGMLSRKLVCEVTATGTNGQVITKRSESLLEQGIIEPIVLSSIQQIQVKSGSDAASENITLDTTTTVFLPPVVSGVDPLSPVQEATCTISDSAGNEIILDVLTASGNKWWEPSRDSEEFILPSDTWQVGDAEVTYSVTTQNGTTTTSNILQIVEQTDIPSVDLDSVQLTIEEIPETDPPNATLIISFSYDNPETVQAVSFFIVRGNKEQGTGNVVGGVQCVPVGSLCEGNAGGVTTRSAIPCSLSEGQNLYLVGWLQTIDGQVHKYGSGEIIDPLTENLNVVQTSEAILLVDSITSGEHCLP